MYLLEIPTRMRNREVGHPVGEEGVEAWRPAFVRYGCEVAMAHEDLGLLVVS